jgi:hypothetical protein
MPVSQQATSAGMLSVRQTRSGSAAISMASTNVRKRSYRLAV